MAFASQLSKVGRLASAAISRETAAFTRSRSARSAGSVFCWVIEVPSIRLRQL